MKFRKRTAASALVVVSLTVQCTFSANPLGTLVSQGPAVPVAGLTKLEEILLMTPLLKNPNFSVTLSVHPPTDMSVSP